MKKLLIFLSIIILITTACNRKNNKESPKDNELKEPNENIQEQKDEIREKIKSMTMEEKIGQLFILGFEGKDIEEETKHLIEDFKIGGLILFSRNIEDSNQIIQLINNLKDLNKNNKIPLFISIDEEGGNVSRLPKEFKKLPQAKKIGDTRDIDLSFKFGELLGLRLKSLGFNLNYAPVMDINSNPKNPVIGNRAFGNNPEVVTSYGTPVMKGIQSMGIISGIKHFPGHGDTDVDSHINLPVINKSLEEIRDFELIPFKKSIEEDVDMIMIAHILFPNIDKEYPSTMSKDIITYLLRKEMGFEGVIISDDLTMGAIIENYTLEGATLKFLQSGGDIALICHGTDDFKSIFEYIKIKVKNEEIPIEDIDNKVYRILKLKKKYNLQDTKIDELNIEEINNKTEEILKKIK